MYRIGSVLFFAAISSCSSGPWPADDQDKFLDECSREGGSSAYCSCFLENVMTYYPNVSDAEKMDFETAVELSKDCK